MSQGRHRRPLAGGFFSAIGRGFLWIFKTALGALDDLL